tara:strand:+ start:695 stop:958 length:264 start_codon:yes stop_codon:yes gene_type:complete
MADATLFADGFEEAVIGVDNTTHNSIPRVVYSKAKMVEVLVTAEKCTVEEALEFLDFNVYSAYMGQGTPIYVNDMSADDANELLEEY